MQKAETSEIINRFLSSGKKVEILPLYKYFSLIDVPDGLRLKLGSTDFGEYLLTNVTHPEWQKVYGDEIMSHPISISIVSLTMDNLLLFGYRSSVVVGESGKIQSIPAGYVHPPNSIKETVINELWEELEGKEKEIEDIKVTGIIRICKTWKPEILLTMKLRVLSYDILNRHGQDRWETSNFLTIENTREEIWNLLVDPQQKLTNAGHAALACHAANMFGSSFLKQLADELYLINFDK